MIVTRFNYPLEKTFVKKLDIIVERIHGKKGKDDCLILFEGGEGDGKTTYSIASAYYVAEKTGRPFTSKNVFFDVDEMFDFAQKTEGQIIIWDEPALQALSTDWAKKAVINLIRLLMMARKKRHLVMINMTKFYKFPEYLVVDRPKCLVHVYARNEKEKGRFVYIPEKKLEALYRDYRFGKKRNYRKHSSKTCRGTFPDILNPEYKNNVLAEFDNKDYETRKDNAIKMIGNTGKDTPVTMEEYKRVIASRMLQYNLDNPDQKNALTQKNICEMLECAPRTLGYLNSKLKNRQIGNSARLLIEGKESDADGINSPIVVKKEEEISPLVSV